MAETWKVCIKYMEKWQKQRKVCEIKKKWDRLAILKLPVLKYFIKENFFVSRKPASR